MRTDSPTPRTPPANPLSPINFFFFFLHPSLIYSERIFIITFFAYFESPGSPVLLLNQSSYIEFSNLHGQRLNQTRTDSLVHFLKNTFVQSVSGCSLRTIAFNIVCSFCKSGSIWTKHSSSI